MAEITADQHIVIGDWVFGTPACTIERASGVWAAPTIRGEDQEIPGVDGEAWRRRVLGPIRFPIAIVLHGDFDPDGVPFTDPRVGIGTNAGAMYAAIMPTGADPRRTLIHGIDGQPYRTGQCIVVAIDGPEDVGPFSCRYSIDIKIPQGGIVPVGP